MAPLKGDVPLQVVLGRRSVSVGCSHGSRVSSVQATGGLGSLDQRHPAWGQRDQRKVVAFTDLAALLASTGVVIPKQASWTPCRLSRGVRRSSGRRCARRGWSRLLCQTTFAPGQAAQFSYVVIAGTFMQIGYCK
jgi:hypothetical protein